MKVRMRDKDGIVTHRYINSSNFDAERMVVVEGEWLSKNFLMGS